MKRSILCLASVILAVTLSDGSEKIHISLDTNQTGVPISDTLYGLFFEDINYAADGGIYPELVNNRSFEYTEISSGGKNPLRGWRISQTGNADIDALTDDPLHENNPTYLRINVTESPYRISNNGVTANAAPDMYIFEGGLYNFSLYARDTDYGGSLSVWLEDDKGHTVSEPIDIQISGSGWKKYGPFPITATGEGKSRLVIDCLDTGSFDLDFVSLMPAGTWGYGSDEWQYGGLRRDLAEALAALNPSFIRFPGGCIVEGAYRHETHYNWKHTVGPPEQRKENPNLWGYMMSYGLGYHEYFQLCADLGAEPVPVIYAGVLCQPRNNGSNTEPDIVPGDEAFDQLIQDYLDLIEYANGGTDTVWGAKRAENGRAEPFGLKMIGVGNENWGRQYWINFQAIKEAILAVHPDMRIITTTGPLAAGWINDEAWREINARHTDTIVDEHYYMEPDWFLLNARRYDSYPRDGAEIFLGEYAAHEPDAGGRRPNTLYAALCEAAMMTGIERNADIVIMSSYAPLMARATMQQWSPNMIWFNSKEITNLTPSYQAQKLFSTRVGTVTLTAGDISYKTLFHASSLDEETNTVYTKLVNPYDRFVEVSVEYNGLGAYAARVETLSGGRKNTDVQPKTENISIESNTLALNLPPYSLTVVTVSDGVAPEEQPTPQPSPAPSETSPPPEQEESRPDETGGSIWIYLAGGAALLVAAACLSYVKLRKK